MSLRQVLERCAIRTSGPGLVEVTGEAGRIVAASGIERGLLTLFCRHSSASLLIQENADPEVRADLERFFERLVPWDPRLYRHGAEGPDDMPAHIRTALTQTQLAVPVDGGRLLLGTWQGIYLFEHRQAPHRREIVAHLMGE